MRFLHISDTHLGYNQYSLPERGKDFFDVFKEAIEIAIDENVDFVIHSGDFFHSSKPSNEAILEGIEILKLLKDKNIPFYLIAGNHDRGNLTKEKSPVEILKHFGANLIENMDIYEFNGVKITGLKYISRAYLREVNSLREIIENRISDKLKDDTFNIILLHQEFNDLFPDSKLSLNNEIPAGVFNYIGVGHYHALKQPRFDKNINATIFYPGATEFTDINEKEDITERYIYIFDINSDKTLNYKEFKLKKNRPVIRFELKEEYLESQLKELKNLLDQDFEKKPLLQIKITLEDLSKEDIISLLEKEGIKEKVLTERFSLIRKQKDLGIEENAFSFNVEENIIIEETINRLITDKELQNKIIKTINEIKTFENIEEIKVYLNSHTEIFEI